MAKESGMDCWFYIDENGEFVDLEGNSKSARKGIRQLFEGLLPEHLKSLSDDDKLVIINLLYRML